MKPLVATFFLMIAIAALSGFGFLVWMLDRDRVAYAEAVIRAEEESLRGESAARLRSTIQGSEEERAALENVLQITILDAVETIESAGKQAGASSVTIGEATPISSTPNGISRVSVVVNAEGTFPALMRAVQVYESLPMPSKLEQFEITKADKIWRLTARIRVTMAGPAPQASPAPTP